MRNAWVAVVLALVLVPAAVRQSGAGTPGGDHD